MLVAENNISNNTFSIKVRAYAQLLKFRLSALVAFSAAFGYVLGIKQGFQWAQFLGLSLGGFLISAASVIINQIIEKDLDKLMTRTRDRPLPTGRVSVQETIIYTIILTALGLGLLTFYTNPLTVILSVVDRKSVV